MTESSPGAVPLSSRSRLRAYDDCRRNRTHPPYLIPNFFTATAVAVTVVILELLTIAWIQWKYMETPLVAAAAKVMLGGGLVLATGILTPDQRDAVKAICADSDMPAKRCC
jgi:hypothetical protein